MLISSFYFSMGGSEFNKVATIEIDTPFDGQSALKVIDEFRTAGAIK